MSAGSDAVVRWVAAQASPEAGGLAWGDSHRLYDGTAGVVLFLLEAGQRDVALSGCDAMALGLDDIGDSGLHTGLGGMALALSAAGRQTDALRAVARMSAGEATDIFRGAAGIGLVQLWAHRALDAPLAMARAVSIGDALLAQSVTAEDGLAWEQVPGAPRLLPNFSHGTAGVAYFLACLASHSGERRFLDAAVAGARHLLSLADLRDDGCGVPHHPGADLWYLGWCHGPAGTGRLFHRLWRATGDEDWRAWFERTGHSLLQADWSGPGLWANRGQCCGHAGIGEYALLLARVTGCDEYAELAARCTEHILDTATEDDDGLYWIEAQRRVAPGELSAPVGYMQGASGIGAWLLHYESFAGSAS